MTTIRRNSVVKETASELPVRRLVDRGVDDVFGLPGDAANGIVLVLYSPALRAPGARGGRLAEALGSR